MSDELTLQRSLLTITNAARAGGRARFAEPTQFQNPRRRLTRMRSPLDTESLLMREFRQTVKAELENVLRLSRCTFVLPMDQKPGIWIPVEPSGLPERIREKSIYVAGEGLTGRVLQGETIYSDNIMHDDRRSPKYGDAWIQLDGSITNDAQAYMGAPLWIQLSDSAQTANGALVAIRAAAPFSEREKAYFRNVAEIASLAHDRLRSWRRRSETDLRQLKISQLWDLPVSDSSKYVEVLRILQEEFPFKRLLLTLVDEKSRRIVGTAAIGFRSDLVAETSRPVLDSDSPDEDILTWVYRERHRDPVRVSPSDDNWRKVHEITAFRHQVKNSLLLIPMWGPSGALIGIILAEDHEASLQLSRHELRRISLFANHAASLMESHQQNKAHRHHAQTWQKIHSVLFRQSTGNQSGDSNYEIARILGDISRYLGLERAAIYRFSEDDYMLYGVAGYGIPWRQVIEHSIPLGLSCDGDRSFAEACFTADSLQCVAIKGWIYGGKLRLKDPSILPQLLDDFTHTLVGSRMIYSGRCLGILFFTHAHEERYFRSVLSHQLSEFQLVLGHLLCLSNEESRASRSRRMSSSYQSLSLAIDEIGKPTSTGDSFSERTAFKSVLRDTANLFDASLTQIFLFEPDPVRIVPRSDVPSQLKDKEMREFETFRDLSSAEKFGGGVGECSRAKNHESEESKQRTIQVRPGKGLTATTVKSLKPVVSPNVEEDQLWSGDRKELAGPRAFLGVPLLTEEADASVVFGVLTIVRSRRSVADARMFRIEEQQIAQSIASLLASALARRGERDRSVRAEKEARDRMTRVRHCQRWFSHDIPNMIAEIEHLADRCMTTGAGSDGSCSDDMLLLAQSTRAVFSACALAFRDPPMADGGLAEKEKDFGDAAIDLRRFRRKLELLFQSDRMLGDTQLDLMGDSEDTVLEGVQENPFLYCAYALCHNAIIACFQNKSNTTKESPGRIELRVTREDDGVVLSVRDDGGGVGNTPIEVLTKELHSEWSNNFMRKSSGMGLFITKRLVDEVFHGRLSVCDEDWNGRRGAVFSVYVPLSR